MLKKIIINVIIALILAFGISALFLNSFFAKYQMSLSDKLYTKIIKNDEISIIAIDDKSIQAIGRWPWQRDVYVKLINKLNKAKPLALGIDVAFSESSEDSSKDAELANAFIKADNIILPVEGKFNYIGKKIVIDSLLKPLNQLSSSARAVGLANSPLDRDGILRRISVQLEYQGKIYQPFFLKVIQQFLGTDNVNLIVDKDGMMMINFAGPAGTFPTFSFSDVLSDKFESSIFKDKIVLLGSTASDLHDDLLTPMSLKTPMSGVEMHANAINTVLTKKFLADQNSLSVILMIFVLCVIIALAVSHFDSLKASLLVIFITICFAVLCVVMFDLGLVLNIFYGIFSIIGSYIVAIFYKYFTEEREKKKIKHAFEFYLSKSVIKEILRDPDKLKLGGEKKNMTILFTDIRSFTTISESMKPEKLVSFLNKYLTEMTGVILKGDGVVDKFIGDAIMAFWGAPLNQPLHAKQACEAALKMIKKLKEIQKEFKQLKLPEINIGIGINSGDVVVGNMGSNKRFDYTVIGDNVNLASRLEGLNKTYGTNIIISENTYNLIKGDFQCRFIEEVNVKGKLKAVKVYELLGKK